VGVRFTDLPIHAETQLALEAMGFEETTPVQEQTIPSLLAGRDLIAQAQTGTGKTAAFGIPLVDSARAGKRGIVLTPTRELAKQVQRELQAIAHGSRVDVVCLIGGAPFGEQARALKRHPEAVLVATPGRVVDHLTRGTLDLSKMGILVLDEADEMLSMGFQDELNAIVATLPSERQTMLFTATMAPNLEALVRRTLRDPVTVRLQSTGKGGAAGSVEQTYALVARRDCADAVRRIMQFEEPQAALLFCNTRERVDELAEDLKDLGAEALHGGISQPGRDAVMERLRKGRTKLLVATDVASRGLDVEEIELVLHDEIGRDAETYIHRIGRTGRAGRKGKSIAFLPPGRLHQLSAISRVVGKLEKYEVPDAAALAHLRIGRLVEELEGTEPGDAARSALERAAQHGMDAGKVALAALELLLVVEVPEKQVLAPTATSAISLKVGAMDNVTPGAILTALVRAGGLRAEDVGRIDILPTVSFAEVPASAMGRLVEALSQAVLSGRRLMPRAADDWKFRTQGKR
jgi:ATP-dependent RNA helicase DeaD